MDQDFTLPLQQQAIQAALASNWEEALRINQEIIQEDPRDVDALNRAARAYFELGNLVKSKEFYKRALTIDLYNPIATKCLKRIETLYKKGVLKHNNGARVTAKILRGKENDSDSFIEEPGKTTIINLIKAAEPQRLSLLSSGSEVLLTTRNRSILVTGQGGEYLGILPDDLSHRLIRLIKGGNKYRAFIKSIKINGLAILIRETHSCPRFKNQPSFPGAYNELTYSSDYINLSIGNGNDQVVDSEDESD